MSYVLEGAKFKDSGTGWFVVGLSLGGTASAPAPTEKAEWSRLSSREFATVEEAQYWLAANGERFVRERVIAVRLLQIVAHYAPHCIAFFPQVEPDTVERMVRREKSTTSAYDGTSGDEWKQDKGGDA